jgi:predicted MPP superfamily phosphohydrolase
VIALGELFGLGLLAAAGVGVMSYAFVIEPRFRLVITRYRLRLPGQPTKSAPLRIAVIADIHACRPWMSIDRIEDIVAATNRLMPDLIVLLGDYVVAMPPYLARTVLPADWGACLGRLQARLGVYAVLGNHDWVDDPGEVRQALADNGVVVMENDAVRIASADGLEFWLAGLGDQRAKPNGRRGFTGVDDLPGTLAQITDDRPIVLLAHEPDIFTAVPARIGLTLCGHTHGGQVSLPLVGRPVVPSAYGQRYAYGHMVEGGRHLIVSGGLCCTGLPVRFGVPPEIVLVELTGSSGLA